MRIFVHVCVCIACVTQLPILEVTHLCPPLANLYERKKSFYNLYNYWAGGLLSSWAFWHQFLGLIGCHSILYYSIQHLRWGQHRFCSVIQKGHSIARYTGSFIDKEFLDCFLTAEFAVISTNFHSQSFVQSAIIALVELWSCAVYKCLMSGIWFLMTAILFPWWGFSRSEL